jgi:DNA oxidative demethylase
VEQTSFNLGSSAELFPEGFVYSPEFLSLEEEAGLLSTLKALEWHAVKMHGVTARRQVAHFGLDYEYDTWAISEGPKIPSEFEPLLVRACEMLKVERSQIAALLATHYPPGAGIGWHRDAPMFGESVFGVSLGGACTMRFRKEKGEGFETLKADLASRSAYLIGGPSRSEWQHSIPPVKFDRYSITVRTRNLNFKGRTRQPLIYK